MSDQSGICPVCRLVATSLEACSACADAISRGQAIQVGAAADIPDPLTHHGRQFWPVRAFSLPNGQLAVVFQEETQHG